MGSRKKVQKMYNKSKTGVYRRFKHKLKFHYNMTPEQYDEMFKKQNGLCAICNKKESYKHHITKQEIRLAVDHCHKTNKIRGLLCRKCNTNLGHFGDDLNGIIKITKYLKIYDS